MKEKIVFMDNDHFTECVWHIDTAIHAKNMRITSTLDEPV